MAKGSSCKATGVEWVEWVCEVGEWGEREVCGGILTVSWLLAASPTSRSLSSVKAT